MDEIKEPTLFEQSEEINTAQKKSSFELVEAAHKATGCDLTYAEIRALVHIHKLKAIKQPVTCSALAAKLGVTLPQVTTLNNSLVKQGLTKHSVPAPKPDRRQRLLATTKKGAEVAAAVEGL